MAPIRHQGYAHAFFCFKNDFSESGVFAVSVGWVTVVMFHTQDKGVPTRDAFQCSKINSISFVVHADMHTYAYVDAH